MSATSWFDLSSIQEQINKSLQEAVKIADDASKYDILNFDEMAKREEEEENEDCEGDDEYNREQLDSNFDYRNDDGSVLNNLEKVSRGNFDAVNFKNTANRMKDLTNTSSDHRSFPRKTQSIIGSATNLSVLSPEQLKYTTATGSTVAPTSSRASDRRNEYPGRDDDMFHDARPEASSFPSITPFSEDFSSQSRLKTTDASGYVTPPITGESNNWALEEGDTDGAIAMRNQNVQLTSESQKDSFDTQGVGVLVSTPLKSDIFDEEEAGDDFFGNQFNAISTIKKEKLRPSSSTPSDTVIMSIAKPLQAGLTSPYNDDISHADSESVPHRGSNASNFNSHSSFLKSDRLNLVKNEARKEKKKSRKNKTNKGGLDFFGMGGADSSVAQLLSSSSSSQSMQHPSVASEPSSSSSGTGFSFFEPVGMLNDDSDKYCPQLSSTVQSQSNSRPLLRLPGITFADVATRSDMNDSASSSRPSASTSMSKTLFSFFDNVENEIDSSEDPILRQVELNKSNPGPRLKPPNLSNIFFYSPASAGNQQDGDDVESHNRTNSVVGGRGRMSEDNMGSAHSSTVDSAAGSRVGVSILQAVLSFLRDQEVLYVGRATTSLLHPCIQKQTRSSRDPAYLISYPHLLSRLTDIISLPIPIPIADPTVACDTGPRAVDECVGDLEQRHWNV